MAESSEPSEDSRELRRMQEVARYYCATQFPLNDVSSPNIEPAAPCDGFLAASSVTSLEPIRPVQISPEPALTALAQLGALKLRCQRAFISLIDHNSQYILAEATQSISIRDQDIHNEGDGLYLGIQSLPLYWGVCPSTMKTFTDTGSSLALSTPNVTANRSRYVIRDFTQEKHLRDRPYVVGWPFMKFYAEVPIRSPAGYVIGGYCVIDDRPREIFGDAEVNTLQEISDSIGNHLELMRMKQDYERAERLMKGLSSFVEGQSSIRLPLNSHQEQSSLSESTDPRAIAESGKSETNCTNYDLTDSPLSTVTKEGLETSANEPGHIQPIEVLGSSGDSKFAQTSMPYPAAQEQSATPHEHSGNDADDNVVRSSTQNSLVPINIKRTFSRASNLIRESMDLEGVVFFDAYLSGLALRSTLRRGRANHSENTSNGIDASSGSDDDWLERHFEDDMTEPPTVLEDYASPSPESAGHRGLMKECERLGQSLSPTSSPNSDYRSLPGPLLKRLLRKYPYGQIFTSERSGYPSSAEQKSWRASDLLHNGSLQSLPRKQRKILAKQTESRLLFDLLPGARSIIFYPLWDSHKARWFAGCIGWTTDPKRALQSEEVTYLAAFGNSVMAEINRIEAVANDRAKSDFISNISHELRSPLHGILASAELLQDSSTGHEQDGMIEMVNSCGRTLLDTMNHLLDYAKINNIAKSKKGGSGGDAETGGSHETLGLTSQFDLSELVEEVVDAVHTGYQYQKRLSARFKNGATANFAASGVSTIAHSKADPKNPTHRSSDTVSVILDICERAHWILSSEPGAWRRIVMNLFGNALKYTQSGFIKVRLSADENVRSTDGSPSAVVRLSITDTGKGISEEYLKNRLYTPFAQEDSLSVGAGLGLSIVQQIVTSLGGTVDISSQVGVGTNVIVSIPLDARHGAPQRRMPVTPNPTQWGDITICLIGFEHEHHLDKSPAGGLSQHKKRILALSSALSQILVHRFGLRVVYASSADWPSANLLIAEEEHLNGLQQVENSQQQALLETRNIPLIVLCKDQSRKLNPPMRNKRKLAYISQPFGPTKLGKALEICLRSRIPMAETDAPNTQSEAEYPLDVSEALDSTPASPMEISQPSAIMSKPLKSTPECGPKVLLVDDNDINLKIMVTYMRKLRWSYVTAINGLQAFERYRDAAETGTHFKYVLMDVSMPVMDGLSSTREIRAFEREKGVAPTTIIALTGLASPKTEEEAFASGVDLFLTKPVQLRRLKDVLKFDEDEMQAYETNGWSAKKRKVAEMG